MADYVHFYRIEDVDGIDGLTRKASAASVGQPSSLICEVVQEYELSSPSGLKGVPPGVTDGPSLPLPLNDNSKIWTTLTIHDLGAIIRRIVGRAHKKAEDALLLFPRAKPAPEIVEVEKIVEKPGTSDVDLVNKFLNTVCEKRWGSSGAIIKGIEIVQCGGKVFSNAKFTASLLGVPPGFPTGTPRRLATISVEAPRFSRYGSPSKTFQTDLAAVLDALTESVADAEADYLKIEQKAKEIASPTAVEPVVRVIFSKHGDPFRWAIYVNGRRVGGGSGASIEDLEKFSGTGVVFLRTNLPTTPDVLPLAVLKFSGYAHEVGMKGAGWSDRPGTAKHYSWADVIYNGGLKITD